MVVFGYATEVLAAVGVRFPNLSIRSARFSSTHTILLVSCEGCLFGIAPVVLCAIEGEFAGDGRRVGWVAVPDGQLSRISSCAGFKKQITEAKCNHDLFLYHPLLLETRDEHRPLF